MSRPSDLTIWWLTIAAQAFVVYLFLCQRLFRRFVFLNSYLLLSVTSGITRYILLSRFGPASDRYAYLYFLTDVMLAVSLFLSICELSVRVVGTQMPHRTAVLLSTVALLVAVWISFPVAGRQSSVAYYPVLSQNIFYLSCFAISLVSTWKLRENPHDWLAGRIANVLGIYFVIFFLAWNGAQRNARDVSTISTLVNLSLMANAWVPLGIGFALVAPAQSRRTEDPD